MGNPPPGCHNKEEARRASGPPGDVKPPLAETLPPRREPHDCGGALNMLRIVATSDSRAHARMHARRIRADGAPGTRQMLLNFLETS